MLHFLCCFFFLSLAFWLADSFIWLQPSCLGGEARRERTSYHRNVGCNFRRFGLWAKNGELAQRSPQIMYLIRNGQKERKMWKRSLQRLAVPSMLSPAKITKSKFSSIKSACVCCVWHSTRIPFVPSPSNRMGIIFDQFNLHYTRLVRGRWRLCALRICQNILTLGQDLLSED